MAGTTALTVRLRRSRRAPLPNQRGFSFLEIIITTALLAVVALMIFTAFAIGARAVALAGGMSMALSMAEETLAAARAAPCGPPRDDMPAPPPGRPGTYRREVTTTPLPSPGLWEVGVRVNWTQGGMRRTVSLTTVHYVPRACTFTAP